ncbi:MAG: GAF domain-containing protein [Chloroflexi bacterium]|nr:GAF domain-containing protein [Chloroflexota bacterium]
MSKQTPAVRPTKKTRGASASLLHALNRAAAALQASVHSQDQVFRVVHDQIDAMGLRGGLSLLDATGANLVLRVVVQPAAIMRALKPIQTLLHLDIAGFTFPVESAPVYHQVITTGTTVFQPESSQTLLQLLPENARHLAATIVKIFGASPAIFAPLIQTQRVIGALNLVGKSLTADDIPAMQAFANHIAIALDNAELFAAQRASEERFRALIEHTNDLIAVLSANGTIQYVSPSVKAVLHYRPADLIGKTIFELAHPDDVPAITSALAHRAAHPGVADEIIEARIRLENGAFHWLEASGNNLLDNPAVGGIVLTCHDISARKRADETLARRDAILQAVSFAAGLFIKQAAWAQNIPAVLTRLGEATGVSRVYIFENFSDATGALFMCYRNEWCAPGITPQIDQADLQKIPYAAVAPRWAEAMSRGDLIFGNIREFPQSEKEVLAAQDIQSLIAVPIFVGATWWGFIGFDECRGERAWSRVERDALKTAADLIGEAIQRQRVEDELGARERHLILLNEITRAGVQAADLPTMLQTFADRLGELFDADGAYISFWDADKQQTIPMAAYGPLRETYPQDTGRSGPSMTGSTLNAGHTLVAEDVFNTPYLNPQIAALYPTRSLLGLPLIVGAQKFGAALIGFNQPHKFTAVEIARGEQAAGQIALAIAKMQALESERARVAELQAVQRATLTLIARLDLHYVLDAILDSALQLATTTKDAHIFLYDNDRLTFGAARWMDGRRKDDWAEPRQNGLTYTVARTGQTIIVPDMAHHPIYATAPTVGRGGIIGLPLKIGERVIGVMNLAYAEPHNFSASETRVLRLLADHAAIAIENARLFEAEKQRAAELEAIRQASISLTSSLDLQTVLNSILANALRLAEVRVLKLHADQAAIAIENARLFAAERAARTQAEFLRQAAQAISATLELDEVLRQILDQLKRMIPCDTASVFLFKENGAPDLIAGIGYRDEISTSHVAQKLLEPSPILRRMMQDHQPIIIPDVRENAEWIWVPGAEHVRAFLAAPILAHGEVIGVLMLDHHTVDAYHETDLRLAQTLAQHLAIAIENARHYEQTQQRAREFAALYDTARDLAGQTDVATLLKTIIERATRLLDAPDGVIYLYDAARAELINAANIGLPFLIGGHLSIHQGASGRVVQTRQPIRIEDYQHWEGRRQEYAKSPIGSVAQVPILYHGELIGVLGVAELVPSARQFTNADVRLLELFASQAASAVHQARSLAELQQRADQFAALYDTARELAEQYETPVLLQTIIARVMKLTGASNSSIYLYDPARGDLEITLSSDPITRVGTRLKLGKGAAGHVAATRQPILIDDYATWEGRAAQFAGYPYAAVVQTPILFGGELVGVLSAHENQPSTRKFTPADLDILSLFAGHAASALHTAHLLEQANLRADQLTRLYDAGLTLNRVLEPREQLEFLLKTAMQALRGDYAQFFRWDAATNTLHYEWGLGHNAEIESTLRKLAFPVQGPHSIAGWVIQNHIPMYLPDVSIDPRYITVDPEIRAGLWVPIDHEDERRGVLAVLSKRLNAFTPQDERLLTLFANQVAVAMENARLFEETHRHLAELQTVNRISIALRAAHTLDEMLPLLVSETAAIVGGAHASIWLYDRATNELRQAAQHHFQAITLPLKPGEGIAGHVFVTGEPYIAREFKTDPLTDKRVRADEPAGLGGVCVPIRTVEETIGVLFASVTSPRMITASEIHLTTTIAEIAGNAIHRMRLNEQTHHLLANLTFAYDETIEGWARALDLRDKETQGHTRRVVELTLTLARALGVPENRMQFLRWGALLHDIGKVGIPDTILLKPGSLDANEWEIMRLHPAYAHRLLAPIEYLRDALDIPYCHHEKWDGTGYPRGLAGEAIPLAARIFAVVDVWDALCANRPYRAAWPRERAREHIREQAGTHFDPRVVEMFLRLNA